MLIDATFDVVITFIHDDRLILVFINIYSNGIITIIVNLIIIINR